MGFFRKGALHNGLAANMQPLGIGQLNPLKRGTDAARESLLEWACRPALAQCRYCALL